MEAGSSSLDEGLVQDSQPASKVAVGKVIRWSVAVLVVIAAGAVALHYWRQSELYVSTDNAYVNANMVEIAAQVSGPVVAIHVRDQQTVKAGDPLFEIDPRPFELALESAKAQLELARQSNSSESAAVAMAQAQVAQRQAELRNAQANEKRATGLIARNLMSKESAEATSTRASTAEAAVKAAEANLEQAKSSLGKVGESNAAVRGALVRVEQAQLDLDHTKIAAPVGGLLANFSLRPGSMVQKEAPLFALISDEEYWVDANFKETELDRVHPGQEARIVVDMYRDHAFKGQVESLSGGSGAAFSLLPPQNATGNWVKVTQRVPVKIRIVDPTAEFPLRIGTTATVHVTASSK